MKRILLLALAFILAISTLSFLGCSEEEFDFNRDLDKVIDNLQDNGYKITQDTQNMSSQEVKKLVLQYDREIKLAGKTLNSIYVLERQVVLESNHNSAFCKIIKFDCAESAQAYADIYFAKRETDSEEKIACHENIFVITNSDYIQEKLDFLKFT